MEEILAALFVLCDYVVTGLRFEKIDKFDNLFDAVTALQR